jgi:trehalose 6-phosphate phosphatase
VIHLLSNRGYEGFDAIRELARARALLVLDFDGTLAPIVEDPDEARVGEHTRALLRAAALLFPCAVVSGRARADLALRLARIPALMLAGNHGAEQGDEPPPPALRARVREWATTMSDALHDPRIRVEDKGFSLAIHYRGANDPAAARDRIVRLASLLPGVRIFGGHAVVNLAPIGAPTKGDAVKALAAQFPPWPVVFIGDDETDEDAFRSPVVTHPIRVGWSEQTAARYYVSDRAEVDTLLSMLVSERARACGLTDGWQQLDIVQTLGGAE